jgi:translation initiation factor IF-3
MDQKPINEQIKDAQLLVIDENGVKLGKMDRQTAINNAKDKGLDLILFVPANKTGTLSIAKIGDYGKYAYEQKIKAKQSKKKQTIISTKEVKVRPQIGNHDLT